MTNCHICGKRSKTILRLKASKLDSLGFFFLSLAILLPIGFIAYGLNSSVFDQFFGGSNQATEPRAGLVAIMAALNFIGAVIALAFTIYKLGRPLLNFFSLFVNYKLLFRIKCLPCNRWYYKFRAPSVKPKLFNISEE